MGRRSGKIDVATTDATLDIILTLALEGGIDPFDLCRLASSLGLSTGLRRELEFHGGSCPQFTVMGDIAYAHVLGDRLDVARRQLSNILSGRKVAYDAELRRLAAGDRAPVIDVTTARLVAALGVRPLAAVALAALARGEIKLLADASGDNPRMRLSATHPAGHAWCRTFVLIAPDVKWHAAGMLRLRMSMPDKILAALPGRPLTSLVSHPVLDLEPHTMRGVSTDAGGRHVVRLRTGGGVLAAFTADVPAAGRRPAP